LGNTPAVCRSSYICPEIIESFEQGIVIRRYFQTVAELVKQRTRGLHVAEKALLNFLKRSRKKVGKKTGT
jgi:DNA topoisomerase IB